MLRFEFVPALEIEGYLRGHRCSPYFRTRILPGADLNTC